VSAHCPLWRVKAALFSILGRRASPAESHSALWRVEAALFYRLFLQLQADADAEASSETSDRYTAGPEVADGLPKYDEDSAKATQSDSLAQAPQGGFQELVHLLQRPRVDEVADWGEQVLCWRLGFNSWNDAYDAAESFLASQGLAAAQGNAAPPSFTWSDNVSNYVRLAPGRPGGRMLLAAQGAVSLDISYALMAATAEAAEKPDELPPTLATATLMASHAHVEFGYSLQETEAGISLLDALAWFLPKDALGSPAVVRADPEKKKLWEEYLQALAKHFRPEVPQSLCRLLPPLSPPPPPVTPSVAPEKDPIGLTQEEAMS
jgi:hypothetical protein